MNTEVDIDLNEAKETQDEIYAEQQRAGLTAAPETVEASKQALSDDLKARENQVIKALNEQNNNLEEAPEGVSGIDQLRDREEKKAEAKPEKTPQEILKELGLKEEHKTRAMTDAQGNVREYVQKPLSFIGKIQFLSYIGEVLDKAMSGQNALQLNSLFEVPAYRGDTLSAQDFADAQTFVQALGKILIYAPDFLTKSYAIWLRVPEHERAWFDEAMENLSDDDGEDIIETFIDQNWETLQSFFTERLAKIGKRLNARYRVSQLEQSKR